MAPVRALRRCVVSCLPADPGAFPYGIDYRTDAFSDLAPNQTEDNL
mgnify:CR=1 FL=1